MGYLFHPSFKDAFVSEEEYWRFLREKDKEEADIRCDGGIRMNEIDPETGTIDLKEYSKKLCDWLMENEEEKIIQTLFVDHPVAVERLTRLLHKYLMATNSMLCPKCYSLEIAGDGGLYVCCKCNFRFFQVEA